MSRQSQTRQPLSKERVLHAAVDYVDAHGIDALSMRKLAQELGVEAMSLYNHVPSKDEILGGIVDVVAAEIELPARDASWRVAIRDAAASAHAMFLRHRWAPRMWMRQGGLNDARTQFAELLLRALDEGGFSEETTYRAFHVLQSYILGYTLQELDFPYTRDEIQGMATDFLDEVAGDEFSHMRKHVMQHLDGSVEGGSGFEFGLDLILDGLERVRDAA